MNNPYLFHPAMAPFTPRPCPPVPPPPARHPGLYEDMDGYTRKEIDDADARTLASAKGYADGTKVGKADLFDNPDSAPKIKSELLPSYVDDVLEYASLSDFPAAGESGKIYIAKDTNKTYRWSGTQYVQVGGGGDVPITVVKRNGTALTPVGGAVDIEVPTGTAASKDVPASGDADENQVVLGNDSRLTDSRVPTQHYHSMDDISDLAFPNHKVWAATATGSGTLYTLTPFGNDFSLEEGCVIIYKCPADMGNAGVVYIKVGSAQHLLHWAKSGTQPTFSSVKSGDICIIQFRSDYGGWWALHGVNAYTAYQKPSSGIPSTDLASAVQTALTNARTPTAHASTHRSDGADPLDGSMIEVGGTGTYATAGIDTAIESIDTEIGNINTSLSGKVDSSDLATVATTGDYDDLLNKPTIPSAQVNADWNAASGVAQILNKPTIPDVSGKADAASLAAAYNPAKTSAYAVGDYVTYQGALYKCSTATANPPGDWDSTKWTPVAVTDEMGGGGITGVKLNGAAITPDAQGAVDVLAVPWANANKNAVSIGPNTTVSDKSLVVGNSNSASGVESIAAGWNNSASGNHSFAFGQEHSAEGLNSFAIGENCYACGKDSFAGGYRARTNPNNYGAGHWGAFVWNGGGGNSWYSSHGDGTFNVKTQGGANGFYIGEDTLTTVIKKNTNYLPYASTTTLAPETAVYRAEATGGVIPAVTLTGIPTSSSYFQFEYEVTVPADATLDSSNISAWTWVTGKGLPTSDYAGKTIYIKARLDCTARTVRAECYDVA